MFSRTIPNRTSYMRSTRRRVRRLRTLMQLRVRCRAPVSSRNRRVGIDPAGISIGSFSGTRTASAGSSVPAGMHIGSQPVRLSSHQPSWPLSSISARLSARLVIISLGSAFSRLGSQADFLFTALSRA
jgi:hypothetical protein